MKRAGTVTRRDAELAKQGTIAVAEKVGRGFRRSSYAPANESGSLLEDGTTDCWTFAWLDGRTYVEGRVLLHGRTVAHAWVLDDDGQAVEVTGGYEDARAYVGVVINREVAEEVTGDWDLPRSSIIGTSLVACNGRIVPADIIITNEETV